MDWGTPAWFDHILASQGTDEPGAYFAYEKNGFQRARHASFISKFLTIPPDVTGATILDIGTATGDLLSAVASVRRFERKVGTDFVENLVKTARRKHPDMEFEVGGFPKLQFADGQFNTVLLSEVLYYVPENDRIPAMAEIARVLAPGGVLFISSALGKSYLNEAALRRYLAGYFEIDRMWFDCFKPYHKFMRPFSRLHRLSRAALAGGEGDKGRLGRFFQRHPAVVANPVVRGGARCGRYLANLVIGSGGLASGFEAFSRRLAPRAAASNMLVVARKR